MKKIGIFVFCVILLNILVSGVIAEEYELKINKGWNLVSVVVLGDVARDLNLQELDKIGALYWFDNLNKEYLRAYPEKETTKLFSLISRLDGSDVDFSDESEVRVYNQDYGLIVNSAMWVYSLKKFSFKFDLLYEPLAYENLTLKKGWNFISVTPEMTDGYSINDLKGNCDIKKAYTYGNGWRDSWQDILISPLNKEDLWKGIVIDVSEDCSLSLVNQGGPPSLPGIDISNENPKKCYDTDRGKNYFKKGEIIIEEGDFEVSGLKDNCVIKTLEGSQEGYYIEFNNEYYDSIESCDNLDSNCYLAESYCLDDLGNFEVISCPNGCSNGVCVQFDSEVINPEDGFTDILPEDDSIEINYLERVVEERSNLAELYYNNVVYLECEEQGYDDYLSLEDCQESVMCSGNELSKIIKEEDILSLNNAESEVGSWQGVLELYFSENPILYNEFMLKREECINSYTSNK